MARRRGASSPGGQLGDQLPWGGLVIGTVSRAVGKGDTACPLTESERPGAFSPPAPPPHVTLARKKVVRFAVE